MLFRSIKNLSQTQIHCDAALNAMKDAGLKASDIDGVACAGELPVNLAWQLGITPKWHDGTYVGGCSFMLHVRHAAAAIMSAHRRSRRRRLYRRSPE